MRRQALGNVRARGTRILGDQVTRPHHDPGNAEPALQARGGDERFLVDLLLRFRNPLHSPDFFALGFGRVDHARDHRLAVQEHRATAALALRRAAVLG